MPKTPTTAVWPKGLINDDLVDKPIDVAGMWRSFRKNVIPPTAAQVQVIECKRAFYAGVQSMQQAYLAISDVVEDETQACMVFQGMSDELITYRDSIGTPLETTTEGF